MSEIGSFINVLRIFARIPFGGSFVIFIPDCSMLDGKVVDGYVVSQSRKSELTLVPAIKSSTIFSRVESQLVAR